MLLQRHLHIPKESWYVGGRSGTFEFTPNKVRQPENHHIVKVLLAKQQELLR